MSKFWDRQAKVIVARDPPLEALEISTPLRIQFKVKKKPFHPPNTCEIIISNLSRETRGQLQKFGAEFELYAGYTYHLPNLPLLFRGQSRTVDHKKQGAEWNTVIQAGDGDIAYRFARVNIPWAPGTSIKDILSDLATSMRQSGIDVTTFLNQLRTGKITTSKSQFVTGFATSGNPYEEIEKILAPEGWILSIQNGELQAISSKGTTPREAVLISDQSGLIGSPTHGAPDHSGLPSQLKVHTLLLPKLNPGDTFILDTESIKGTYRAEDVLHSGDTHGHKWNTEIDTRMTL